MENQKTSKTKKIVDLILNILSIIICLLVLLISINTILSSGKGYNTFFGRGYYAVASDSMEGTNPDSFSKGDVISVKILNDEEKNDLKVGDVITFFDYNIIKDGQPQLNTHRITKVVTRSDGTIYYQTKGDNQAEVDGGSSFPMERSQNVVIGKYAGKFNGIGNILLWMNSKVGFAVCVIVPSFLVVAYCVYLVIVNVMAYNKKKLDLAKTQMREQLLAELQSKQNSDESTSESVSSDNNTDTTSDNK